ncbi:hypothetical protein pb186bvf_000899 [Paramecium bursaria]
MNREQINRLETLLMDILMTKQSHLSMLEQELIEYKDFNKGVKKFQGIQNKIKKSKSDTNRTLQISQKLIYFEEPTLRNRNLNNQQKLCTKTFKEDNKQSSDTNQKNI